MTKPTNTKLRDQELRLLALDYALRTPDHLVATYGIVPVAAIYYNFIKGENAESAKSDTRTTTDART